MLPLGVRRIPGLLRMRVGTETLDGETVTHYRGELTLEQVRDSILNYLEQGNAGHYGIGRLYNYTVDNKLGIAQIDNGAGPVDSREATITGEQPTPAMRPRAPMRSLLSKNHCGLVFGFTR